MKRWSRAPLPVLLLVAGLVITACGVGGQSETATPSEAATAETGEPPLIPASATLERARDLVRDPMRDPLPDNEVLAQQIQRGYAIFMDTPTNAPSYSGNDLSCTNCHLNGGQKEQALPLVGVAGVFPSYNARAGRLITLEDRIRGCFVRSMNADEAPPYDSEELLAVAAYISWISDGQPTGHSPAWRGQNRIAPENQIPIDELDVAAGEQLYNEQCVACHGPDGQGFPLGEVQPGPLWGQGSWNDGAGAARVYTLAGYLRYAMPLSAPGTLTDEQAQLIAAYIDSQARPEYPNKANDYPNGDVPVDGVYYPQRYPDGNPLRP